VPVIHWFRKDLRLEDNTALGEARSLADDGVIAAYLSEPAVLSRPDMAPVRTRFVLDALAELGAGVEKGGGRLVLRHGDAVQEMLRLVKETGASAVTWNAEYEPDLARRDAAVRKALEEAGVAVRVCADRFLVPPDAVATQQGTPYTVFTPFRKACEAHPIRKPAHAVRTFLDPGVESRRLATLEDLGESTEMPRYPSGASAARKALARFLDEALYEYADERDRPDHEGTSRLSHHLRFGTISARQAAHGALAAIEEAGLKGGAAAKAKKSVETFVSEIRWRDFFGHVLHHFPHVVSGSFRKEYDALAWVNDEESFEAWCRGRTGYPIVDAGMRQLAATGWMHNRVRMIVASFLTKDLLIDWRKGERWFMNHLVDGDPASNNGGWQWAASTGTDAQPYFRIFNPVLQGKRFDPDGAYVKAWIPELADVPAEKIHEPWAMAPLDLAQTGVTLGETYPERICDHFKRKEMALALYGAVKG